MSKQTIFINSIKEGAIDGYLKYKILPSLTIAQAILESGWGKSGLTKRSNNLFGIKADSRWKGKISNTLTKEYNKNGSSYTINANFRAYDNLNDSIKDHNEFLYVNKRYSKVLQAKNYKDACNEIYKAGYATDPKYPQLLIKLIEQYRLYEIDKEAELKMHSQINRPGDFNPLYRPTNPNNIPSPDLKEFWDWAVKEKIFDGSNPKGKITREQFAKVLYTILNRKW